MMRQALALLMSIGLVVTVCQWKQWKSAPKRDKATYVSLLVLVWGIAVTLWIDPKMPGPSQLVAYVFRPLSQLLE